MSNGPAKRTVKYRSLTRDDLAAFEPDAKELIMEAIDAGCTGKISTRGHCILRNDHGNTVSIARKLKNLGRSGKNSKAAMKRFLAEQNGENHEH